MVRYNYFCLRRLKKSNNHISFKGFTSYPRTETTHYDKSFDLKKALQPFAPSYSPWHDHVTELLAKGINKPKDGIDAGDHPPITPLRLAGESDLGFDEWRLYDLITSNFISSISNDCKYYKTTALLQLGMFSFVII